MAKRDRDAVVDARPVVHVMQDPPGSGKTYRVVHEYLLRAPELQYEYVFVVTKPHSAKEVVRRELDAQIDQLCTRGGRVLQRDYINKCHIVDLAFADDERVRYFIATGDSFLYAQWKITSGGPHNTYERMCHQIAEGHIRPLHKFKQRRASLGTRALLCVDEATKFDVQYYEAFMHLVTTSKCDMVVTGDVLQSIESNENLLTRLRQSESTVDVRVEVHEGRDVRRCGQALVDMFTTVVGPDVYAEHSLSIPVSVRQEFDPSFDIFTHPPLTHPDHDSTAEHPEVVLARRITEQMIVDVRRLYLLPYDVIVVMPLVNERVLPNALQTHMHDAWVALLEDQEYKDAMARHRADDYGAYVAKRAAAGIRAKEWLCVHHYSQNGKPIDTRRSDNATRIVSVHASQGDGRRLAITVDITYAKLCKFVIDAEPHKTLQYNSFVNVALSRCKQHQTVWLAAHRDDIWNRFVPFMTEAQRCEVPPDIRHLTKFVDVARVALDNVIAGHAVVPMCTSLRTLLTSAAAFTAPLEVEWEHHAVSMHVFIVRALLRLGTKGHMRAMMAIVGKLCTGRPEEFNVKSYYNFMRELREARRRVKREGRTDIDKSLSVSWPVMEHRHEAESWQDDAKILIKNTMCELRKMLQAYSRRDDDLQIMSCDKMQPMHFVCLSYILGIHQRCDDRGLSITTLYDIARAYLYKSDVTNMYNRINQVDQVMDIVEEQCPGGEWDYAPKMHLGTSENETTPEFEVDLEGLTNTLLHTSARAATFVIFTHLGTDIDKIVTRVVTNALVAWRPRIGDDAKLPRKVSGKAVHAIVVDVKTGSVYRETDMHVQMPAQHPLIVDRLLLEIKQRNSMYHEVAAEMICTKEGRAKIQEKSGFTPRYLEYVSMQVDEGDLEDDVCVVWRRLDKKLASSAAKFHNAVCD